MIKQGIKNSHGVKRECPLGSVAVCHQGDFTLLQKKHAYSPSNFATFHNSSIVLMVEAMVYL
jgi:hypothetical protein